MHTPKARKRWIILVDSAPVLPSSTEGNSFGWILKQVRNFPYQSPQGISRGIRKEGKDSVDEQRCREPSTVIGRNVFAESRDLRTVVTKKVGGAFNHRSMPNHSRSILGSK